MFGLLQITAEYSNAVLVAVLPYVADFARKLDLPDAYSARTLLEFRCDPRAGAVGGALRFTNGCEFWFESGRVRAFRSPRSYQELQSPDEIPRLFGPLRMTEPEALSFAREKVRSLGYSLPGLYADQPPSVTPAPIFRGHVVPRYHFDWLDPLFQSSSVRVEVDAERKEIVKFAIFSPGASHPPPELTVSSPKPTVTPPWDAANSNSVVQVMLRNITPYIDRMSLDVSPPRVEDVQSVSRGEGPWEHCIYLRNGFAFTANGSEITGFFRPKCILHYPRTPDAGRAARDYIGTWKLNEEQAIAAAQTAIRKADPSRTRELLQKKPLVSKAKSAGIYIIPRYFIVFEDAQTNSQAEAEVDGCDGSIRHLFVFAAVSDRAPARSRK